MERGKMNVLVNAYAVSPNWGSEPGLGWNWIVRLARHGNVYVITEGEWRSEIEAALETIPEKDNIHFYYNPVPDNIRRMCWNQGDWRFYHYYKKWQRKTKQIALDIMREHKIDVIHHLNMIGFREPGYLWQISDVPFVWGPIGNMSPLDLEYISAAPISVKVKSRLKNWITYYQARHGRVKKAIKAAGQVITALEGTADIIKEEYGLNNILVMLEAGLNVSATVQHDYQHKPLRLLWVGRFIPTKKLDLALQVLAEAKSKAIELHIVGWGNEAEETYYKNIAQSLGVDGQCKWYGKIPNKDVQALMRNSDAFLFTSVVEGCPHVVLEAISNNLPVVCFDLCGQGVMVDHKCGIKIPVPTLSDAKEKLVECIDSLAEDKSILKSLSEGCDERKPELSWDSKIQQILDIYKKVIVKKTAK